MVHVLGWLGSALIVASLAQDRPVPFRLLNLVSAVVLLVFNLAIGLWSMVALNVVIIAVNSWQLRAIYRRAFAPRSETIAEQSDPAQPLERTISSTPSHALSDSSSASTARRTDLVNGASSWIASTNSTPASRSAVASSLPTN
jgi:cytoskeletal protein RodZ